MALQQRAEPTTEPRDRLPLAAGLDTAFVVLFVAAGRRTHDQDPGIAGLIETAAPFVIGLAAGWLIARAWREPARITTGVIVWASTLVIGMLLRRYVFDEGTATSFVVVAGAFLAATLVGWRAVLAGVDVWRARRGKLAR